MRSNSSDHHDDEFWSPIARPHFLDERSCGFEPDSDAETELDTAELPFAMYLPERYEPRYAYPVVIWLHGNGRNEHQLQQVMPGISDQNYIGVAFRGTSDDGQSPAGAFQWDLSEEKLYSFAEEIAETLGEMQRFLRIDPQRVYLAGHQGGASMALELLLRFPQQFRGAIAFDGLATPTRTAYANFRLLSSRRVLLGCHKRHESLTPQDSLEAARRLNDCGLEATSRVYDCHETLSPKMLRDIDLWVMSACENAMA